MKEERLATAVEILRAISSFEFQKAHDLVTEDVIVEQGYPALGQPEQYQGREAFIAGLNFVPSIFEEFQLSIIEAYDVPEKDMLIFEQRSRGIVKTTQEVYDNLYVMMFKFRDGKVYHWREYYNPEIMTTGLGPAVAALQA